MRTKRSLLGRSPSASRSPTTIATTILIVSAVVLFSGITAVGARTAPPGAGRPAGRPRGVEHALKSRATVKLIQGFQKRSAYPKNLAAWRRQLTRPPFSAFQSFRLIKNLDFNLSAGRPVTAVLVGPYVLTVKLLNRVVARRGQVRYRFELKLMAKRRRRSQLLHSSRMLLDRGGTFFLAGPKHQSGTLILGITLR